MRKIAVLIVLVAVIVASMAIFAGSASAEVPGHNHAPDSGM